MKVQKIVSLDAETASIAKSMNNFSGWVRKMLKLHAGGIDLVQVEENRMIWVQVARRLANSEDELMAVVQEVKELNE